MGSPQDIAAGRIAQTRGWVDPQALRAVYSSLPPHQGLLDALVQRGLLQTTQAQAIARQVAQEAASQPGAAQTVLPSGSGAVAAPPPAPRVWTPHAVAQSATQAAWAGAPQLGSTRDPTPPPVHPGQLGAPACSDSTLLGSQGGESGSLDAATLVGGSAIQHDEAALGQLPQPGTVLAGRYEIAKVLGQGGMGAVYLASDRHRRTQVALKVMLPGAAGDQALIRFRREAEALAKVDDHVGIVRIRDYGSAQGLPYAALDLVEGGDLHERVKAEGPLPVAEAIRLTVEVSRAIQHCHERSILHRDLKPANIMVRTSDGAPFVTDFGLALDGEDQGERLTETGQVMGTPAYMPPEQAEGDKEGMDARSDVYSLGATLYELLAGEAPFRGEGMAIVKKVLLDEPRDLAARREEVSPDLARIQQKAMAKDPALRYASAEALALDLERLQRGEPTQARPPTRAARMRWRRSQGDKRAIAELIALRVLLPLALILGLAQGVFLLRPWERYQVREAFQHELPAVLAGPLAYPGSSAATELAQQAAHLASTLSPEVGEAPDAEATDEVLRALSQGDDFGDAAEREILAAFALRVQVARGIRPSRQASSVDAEAATLNMLRALGYGEGPQAPSADVLELPASAPGAAGEVLAALRSVQANLLAHEEAGWRAALADRARADPWVSGSLVRKLSRALKPFGGSESWRSAIASRHRALKTKACQTQARQRAQEVLEGRPNALKILSVCERGASHLQTAPAVPRQVLDEAMLEVGLAALQSFGHKNNEDLARAKRVVEVFSDPRVMALIQWEEALARASAAGLETSSYNLLRQYHLEGRRPPARLLLLSFRLGTHHKMFVTGNADHYASEFGKLLEPSGRGEGPPSAATFFFYGEAQNERSRQTEIDRDNPEITLRLVGIYASALGPQGLPLDLSGYEVQVRQHGTPLASKWLRYVEGRLFTLLSYFEHYLRKTRPRAAEAAAQRREATLRSGLSWFRAHGKGLAAEHQGDVISALARLMRECRASLEPQELAALTKAVVACTEIGIERLLSIASQFGGKTERDHVEFSELDSGVGPDHLERTLGALLENSAELRGAEGYARSLERCRQVHESFRASMGRSSPRLFKASVQLTLGNARYEDARVEIEAHIAFLNRMSGPGGSGASVDNLPSRLDGARASLAQVRALTEDLEGARSLRRQALAEGGGKHPHWTLVLPLIGPDPPQVDESTR